MCLLLLDLLMRWQFHFVLCGVICYLRGCNVAILWLDEHVVIVLYLAILKCPQQEVFFVRMEWIFCLPIICKCTSVKWQFYIIITITGNNYYHGLDTSWCIYPLLITKMKHRELLEEQYKTITVQMLIVVFSPGCVLSRQTIHIIIVRPTLQKH